jgi:hypothetical protein
MRKAGDDALLAAAATHINQGRCCRLLLRSQAIQQPAAAVYWRRLLQRSWNIHAFPLKYLMHWPGILCVAKLHKIAQKLYKTLY